MKPVVSIIIPNYNHEPYLKDRLETVFNQTFHDFEVILLDDASTDKSATILDNYRTHPKVSHYVANTTNSGSLFEQWIKGIKLAKGDYIWLAESDDYSDLDFLKYTVEAFQKQPSAGLVFTDTNITDQSGVVLEKASETNSLLASFVELAKYKIDNEEDVAKYFISNLIIDNASAVLFKRSALNSVDFSLLKNLKNAGDLFTYISIGINYDLIYLNKTLNNYRSHGQNTTLSNIKSGALFRDRLIIFNHLVYKLKNLPESAIHLKNFLNRNFLTAVDFEFYSEMNTLLKSFYQAEIISFKSFISLKLYVFSSRIFKNKLPFFMRSKIKKVLSKNINS